MKYNLLSLVQKVLSRIDDTPVNSVDDTEEAQQIVDTANVVYSELMNEYTWPHLQSEVQLETTTVDNVMYIPVDVLNIHYLRYNKKDIIYISPFEMRDKLDSRDTTLTNVDATGAYTDVDPTYWTMFGDEEVTFDSYDGALVAANSLIYVTKDVSELISDTDQPDMPNRFHPVWLTGVLWETYTSMGESNLATRYERKYNKQLAALKRWYLKYGKKSTVVTDYGRQKGLTKTYTKVIDAS